MTDPAPDRPSPDARPATDPGTALRRGLLVAGALVIAWAAFLAAFGPSGAGGGNLTPPRLDPAGQGSGPKVGSWVMTDLEGHPVDFASFRGKPVLLNLWATWCPPCVAEMPSLARLAADPKMKDVAVVCASLDGSREAPRRFADGKGWGMTLLHAGGGIPDVLQTDGIPATFVIDPDGRVVAAEVGSAKWDDPGVVKFFERWARPK